MTNLQSILNVAAGAPLVAVIVAMFVVRRFTKLVKRLLVVGILCGVVLLANNAQLLAH